MKNIWRFTFYNKELKSFTTFQEDLEYIFDNSQIDEVEFTEKSALDDFMKANNLSAKDGYINQVLVN